MTAPVPLCEESRLEALRRYEVLDTAPEAEFDDLVRLAALICRTPIALVSLVDGERQWFKSRLGIGTASAPREQAFCAHAIVAPERMLEVTDATEDWRFAASPLVTAEPRIRFYAGAPVVTADGHALGTVCVMDRRPRRLSGEQMAALMMLGRHAMTLLELRRRARELERAAHAATEAKREFLALISHELRTPMNGILGMTSLLLESGLSTQQYELAATSLESGETLLTIFNHMLEYAELVAGRVELGPAEFSVSELVLDVHRQLLPAAMKKGLALSHRWTSELPGLVYGDARHVHRVLHHFAGNAIKFTARGEVRIEVDIAVDIPGGHSVRFEVRDTGVGVRPEVSSAIFQPFVQGERSRSRGFGGSGLGLAICRKLVELMGGEIGVRSAPGAGAVFWFEIPLARGRSPHAGPGTAALERRRAAGRRSGGGRAGAGELLESASIARG